MMGQGGQDDKRCEARCPSDGARVRACLAIQGGDVEDIADDPRDAALDLRVVPEHHQGRPDPAQARTQELQQGEARVEDPVHPSQVQDAGAQARRDIGRQHAQVLGHGEVQIAVEGQVEPVLFRDERDAHGHGRIESSSA